MDYPAEMEHDGRAYSFTVPGLEVLACESCGERVLPDAAMERVLDTLRAEAELLTPIEIREKRKRLGLTQEQLANQLKVAKETVSRWETGGQIQQRGFDTLLRVFFDLPDVRRYLAERSAGITSQPPAGGADEIKSVNASAALAEQPRP